MPGEQEGGAELRCRRNRTEWPWREGWGSAREATGGGKTTEVVSVQGPRRLAGLERRVYSWQVGLSLITQGPLWKTEKEGKAEFWKINTVAVCQTGWKEDRKQDHEGTVVVSLMAPSRLGRLQGPVIHSNTGVALKIFCNWN